MLKPLTNEQQIKVEENMGLVGKVIQDCVHTLGTGCIYDYDDLFQIGCIGLCKAAQTDQPEYNVEPRQTPPEWLQKGCRPSGCSLKDTATVRLENCLAYRPTMLQRGLLRRGRS